MDAAPTDSWDTVADAIRAGAQVDLEAGAPGGLYLAAAAGADGLFLATSRPFPKGGYADPVIELGSLAVVLGADRVAIGVTGRAWSLDDPIPPVSDEGDLRQRVLTTILADGHGHLDPVVTTATWPFELVGHEVSWGERLELGPPEGWLAGAATLLLTGRAELLATATPQRVRDQFERCLKLGHDIGITAAGAVRLFPQLAEDLAGT